jgi:hypothetical protein
MNVQHSKSMTSLASKTMNFETMRQEYEFQIENEKQKIVNSKYASLTFLRETWKNMLMLSELKLNLTKKHWVA